MDGQTGGYAGMSSGSAADPSRTQSAGARGANVVDQAKDTAQQLAGQVKDQVGQRAESAFDQGKTRAADSLGSVAQTLRQATQQLRDQQQQGASQYVERAAEQMDRLSGYLRTADMHDIADRVEDAARRQPALFLGGVFALGLAGARFLKSSRQNESQQRTGSTGYPGYRGLDRGPSGYRGGASRGGVSATDDDLSGSGSKRGLGDVSGTTSSTTSGTTSGSASMGSTGLGAASLGGLDPARTPRR